MKVPMKWLREYTHIALDAQDYAQKMVMSGTGVEGVEKTGADFIFLEQSFRAEGLQNNDLALMRECREAVGPGRFIVKPHPRNPENVPLQLGLF